jgi:hypothetical protein
MMDNQTSAPTGYNIKADIQLPIATAAWVLGAHLYALLVPLALLLAVYHHWDFLVANSTYPVLFYFSISMMMAGIAFELAQNAVDGWYLTPECASAEGAGFCDFMSFWLFLLSQVLILIAFQGQYLWVLLPAAAAVALFPVLYVRQVAYFGLIGAVGLGTAVAAYLGLGDPVVFLQLLMSSLTMVFFGALLKSGNQALHGFTTIAATSGPLFLAWGIHGGATDAPQSWWLVGMIAVGAVGIAGLLRPRLAALPATVRPRFLNGPPA